MVKEMHRQVGDLQFDDKGIATRGVLVRHLVMPGLLDDTRDILKWLAEEISPIPTMPLPMPFQVFTVSQVPSITAWVRAPGVIDRGPGGPGAPAQVSVR